MIQTKKIRKVPIFLIGKKYWSGLEQWLKDIPLSEKNLDESDFQLFTITDHPDEVADKIESHFKAKGDQPTFDLGDSSQ